MHLFVAIETADDGPIFHLVALLDQIVGAAFVASSLPLFNHLLLLLQASRHSDTLWKAHTLSVR